MRALESVVEATTTPLAFVVRSESRIPEMTRFVVEAVPEIDRFVDVAFVSVTLPVKVLVPEKVLESVRRVDDAAETVMESPLLNVVPLMEPREPVMRVEPMLVVAMTEPFAFVARSEPAEPVIEVIARFVVVAC
jgi:hypothetical protein